MASPSTDNIDPAAAGKRAYVSPTVVEYGTMRDITLSSGKNNLAQSDGGKGVGNNKTR